MKKLLIPLVISTVFLFAVFSPKNATAEDYNWTTHSDLKFTLDSGDLAQNQLPTNGNYNSDCQKMKFVTRPALLFSLIPESSFIACGTSTQAGVIASNYILLNGTNVAGEITLRANKEFLYAGNNSTQYIVADATAPVGVYVNILPSLQLKTTVNLDNSVKYKLVNTSDVYPIKSSDGRQINMIGDTLSFSGNGQYAVFDSSGYGHVRLNLKDGSTTVFGQVLNYGNGFNPSYNTAISGDGRYAIFSTADSAIIYDLDSCVDSSGSSDLKKCQSRQLNAERLAKTNNFSRWMSLIRFTSDKSLSYYGAQRENDVLIYKKFRVTMGDVPKFGMNYLGLGDSFASGEGSFNYKPITDLANNECHVSVSAYQFIIGSDLGLDNYNSVACSGAETKDLFMTKINTDDYLGQFPDGTNQGDRTTDEMDSIINKFTPGLITQSTYISEVKPQVVTISIGGNDIGFSAKIKQCVAYDITDLTCFNSFEDRLEVLKEIINNIPKLTQTFNSLKVNDNQVYVIGYPSIVASGGNCANNVKLNNSEVDFANKIVTLLNSSIKTATEQAGVVYVDTEDILEGFRLCEIKSADALVHGLSEGLNNFQQGDGLHIIAKESFHPKQGAQQLFANRILGVTNNFTVPMPQPNPLASMPIPESSDSYWNVIKTNRPIYVPQYLQIILDVVDYRNEVINKTLQTNQINLMPDSTVKVELHSTPIDLGNFVVGPDGSLNLNFTIPPDVPTGFHAIHIYGTSLAGEAVDIYDDVYIGENAQDFDGDGVLDKDEGCVYSEASGVDSDHDGIDDNCDSLFNIVSTNDPEVIDNGNSPDNLPDIKNLYDGSTPKGEINNETIAGNEPVQPQPETSQTGSSPSNQNHQPNNNNNGTQSSDNIISETNQPQNDLVLGDTQAQQSTPVTTDTGPVGDNFADADKSFYKKANFYYWLIGILATLLIIIFGLRRRTQPGSS